MAELKLFHVIIIIHKYLATYVSDICQFSNTKKCILISQKTVACSCKVTDVLVEGSVSD